MLVSLFPDWTEMKRMEVHGNDQMIENNSVSHGGWGAWTHKCGLGRPGSSWVHHLCVFPGSFALSVGGAIKWELLLALRAHHLYRLQTHFHHGDAHFLFLLAPRCPLSSTLPPPPITSLQSVSTNFFNVETPPGWWSHLSVRCRQLQ